jgi:hypothetical protein
LKFLQSGAKFFANVVQKIRVIVLVTMYRDYRLPSVEPDGLVTAFTAIPDDLGMGGLEQL